MFGIYDVNDFDISYKQRLDIYKNTGFKEVALYLDDNYNLENESYVDIINYAKKIGLEINQVHIDYKISNLICDNTTNQYFDYVSQKLNEAVTLNIPYVIAHASMSSQPPQINQEQLEKFKQMMKSFEGQNVFLCLENVRNNYNLDKILNLDLKNVKMCFDLGHAHCYDNEKQLFEKYQNKIICTHLHNNYGTDSHNILNNGEIDYQYFLENLSKDKNISNCLECFPGRDKTLSISEFEKFIKKCFDSVKEYV